MRLTSLVLSLCASCADQLHADPRAESLQALKKAVTYYRTKVARHGGYVYFTTEDLAQRWGEGKASPDTIFVQPPGTPTVGEAYLKAYAATGDQDYLDAARETAGALVYGQLQSGGWTQVIHFAGGERLGKYRNGKGGSWNASSLDDGQTQAALQFLTRLDQTLDFRDAAVHDAALYGLKGLLDAQFANGAFPQVWTGPASRQPAASRAKFPDYDWKTEGRVKNYWDYPTLNDGLAGTVADTLVLAHAVYKDGRYSAALRRLGDFLVQAQMPAPQPGWCQQYNHEMVPIWARKFEPPAVTGGESQDVMETLVKVARHTGDKKYLEPVPAALTYFRKSLLPDGRVARYYEFGTNKPLYMDANYRLTYDASDAPAHYGWTQPARFDKIEKQYRDAMSGRGPAPVGPAKGLEQRAREVIGALDAEGRWVSTYNGEKLVGQPKFAAGTRYLSSEVFCRNVGVLCKYVASTRK